MDGTTIRFIRNLLEMTQTEFGELAGVHQLTVTRWENGVYAPNKDNVARIRKALGEEALAKIDAFIYEQELKALKNSIKSQVSTRNAAKKKDDSDNVRISL